VAAATNIFDLGGATTFFTDLVTRLHGDGFEVRATAPVEGPHRRWLEDAGVETSLLPAPPVHDPEAYEAWLDEVAPFVEGVDVMLSNTLATFGFADLATRRGIPTVWPVHEPMGMRAFWEVGYGGAMHPRVRALAEDAFRHASSVTICAEATAEGYRPFTDPGRVHVVRYGIDIEALAAAAARFDRTAARRVEGIAEDALVLLCVGTVEERKGQGVLAQAFTGLGERFPGAVLVLLGARDRDPLVGALREHLRRGGDDGRVRIVPTSPDRERWLTMADLLVCASDLEVLPLAVLEGMALGLPVVSTGVFGLPDVVIEDSTGFLCRPCDVVDLAAALERALSHRERLAEMGRRGANMIRDRYAMAPFVEAHADLLRRATSVPSS
jgi:glycosyltransferase involved in cell wall biosynthesis